MIVMFVKWEAANYHHSQFWIHDSRLEVRRWWQPALSGAMTALRRTLLSLTDLWKLACWDGQVEVQASLDIQMPFLLRFGLSTIGGCPDGSLSRTGSFENY